MENYRTLRSNLLRNKYNIIRNGIMNKYGSFDGVPQDGNQPLENHTDQMILEKMINNRTFAVIPVMRDDNYIESIYTIGCWYYWRTPEIVLRFNENIKIEPEFIYQIIGSIHSHLYEIYKDDINLLTVPSFKKSMELTIDKYELTLTLNQIDPDNYLDLHAPYMLWFYAFWDQGKLNDQQEVTDVYPVYLITIDEQTVIRIKNIIIGDMIDRVVNQSTDNRENILRNEYEDLISDEEMSKSNE